MSEPEPDRAWRVLELVMRVLTWIVIPGATLYFAGHVVIWALLAL
jgi:hypothetical protein